MSDMRSCVRSLPVRWSIAGHRPSLKAQADDLHAKVYLSSNGVVVGSANASANGVGLEAGEQASWIEAGSARRNGTCRALVRPTVGYEPAYFENKTSRTPKKPTRGDGGGARPSSSWTTNSTLNPCR